MRVAILFAALAIALPAVLASSWTPTSFSQSVIMSIDMVDDQTGYIAGGDNGVGANVLKTTDGGKTFTSMQTKFAMMFLAITASSADDAVVAGLGLLSGGNQYTTDGEHFTNSSMPKVIMQQTQDVQLIEGVEGGVATTGQFSFAGSNATQNMVAVSNDYGATFDFVNVGGDPNIPARYGSFPSPNVAVIASGTWPPSKRTHRKESNKNVKHVTRNVAVHFDEKTGKTSMHLNREHRKKASDSGWYAQIFVSNDGKTFTQTYENTTFYFNQISCASETVCYAGGENDDMGFGYLTTDGGQTWSELFHAPGTSIMAAYAISEDEAYIAGGVLSPLGINGTVFHITNQGQTVTSEVVPGYYFTDLHFTDSNHGWATVMDTSSYCDILVYA
jgi:photosystem II stability/assembly factor-like uncharacterized protein